VLSEPLTTIGMRQYKLNSLIDLAESGVAFPQNCFIVRRSYFEANRPKIINAMNAVIEGYFILKNDKAQALQLIKKYIRMNDEDAAIGYDYYLARYGEGRMVVPDRRGLQFIIAQVAAMYAKAKGQSPRACGRWIRASLMRSRRTALSIKPKNKE